MVVLATLLVTACGESERQLAERASELCRYIPDHELREGSKGYLTPDFYAVLDTMFNCLNEHEAIDHEWLYYFVTSNGGTIADYSVMNVEMFDKNHAVATISVRQKWEDGSFDESSDTEEHRMAMEKIGGRWLMADFDGHKADCIRHIELSRREDSIRNAISSYLVDSIGHLYTKGDLCLPVLMIVAEEDDKVYGDFWVFNYRIAGDTIVTVSGGNHSGCLTLDERDEKPVVTCFEQTVDGAGNDASARRIFGSHYEIYQNMHSNSDVSEAVRREQLAEYVRQQNAPYRYYRDYGRQAVQLPL